MPHFAYEVDKKAYVKLCSQCRKEVVGTEFQETSEEFFHRFFDRNRKSNDGFQNVCKDCYRTNRRRRNGAAEHNDVEMFAQQKGKCALCNIQIFMPYRFSADPQGARVDHDHKTGRVRGLLCHSCNSMLGFYETLLNRHPEFDIYNINVYIQRQ